MNNNQQHHNNQTSSNISSHHFSLCIDKSLIANVLQDVRFVFIGGCQRRARDFATYLHENLHLNHNNNNNNSNSNETKQLKKATLQKLTLDDSSRFVLYKVNNVLVANHGMGSASMSIALHELFIMCKLANILHKITVVRFGTCGGIGVNPGTLCITNETFDPMFNKHIEIPICNKIVRRSCNVDLKTANILFYLAVEHLSSDVVCKTGATISTNDFYEEQGRTNGAICEHSEDDKFEYLKLAANKYKVINIEMEAHYLVAMCNKLNVAHAIVCVSLFNRLISDIGSISHEQLYKFQQNLFQLCLLFIQQHQVK